MMKTHFYIYEHSHTCKIITATFKKSSQNDIFGVDKYCSIIYITKRKSTEV